MNFTSLLGLGLFILVIAQGILPSLKPHPLLLLHPAALVLVVGGTLAAALLMFPLKNLARLARDCCKRLFASSTHTPAHQRLLVCEFVEAALTLDHDPSQLLLRNPPHPFLQESYPLLTNPGLSDTDLLDLLERRAQFFQQVRMAQVEMLAQLIPLPSAFGLLGVTVGLIQLLSDAASGEATAAVAAFWGLALSTFVLQPLHAQALKAAKEDFTTRALIIDGLMLLKQANFSVTLLADKLNCYLPPELWIELTAEDQAATSEADPAAPAARGKTSSSNKLQAFNPLASLPPAQEHNEPAAEVHDLADEEAFEEDFAEETPQKATSASSNAATTTLPRKAS